MLTNVTKEIPPAIPAGGAFLFIIKDWKPNAECRSLSQLALHVNPASLQLDQFFHNHKPQSAPFFLHAAFAPVFGPVEPVPNMRQVLGRYADTIILNG